MKSGRSWNPISLRRILVAGLLIYLLPPPLLVESQNPKGAIQGVVLRGNTEAPAEGVRVAVYDEAGYSFEKPVQTTTTSKDGNFTLTGLEAGGYYLRFSREGYVESMFGERHTNRGTFVRIVTVTDGQTAKGVVMRLAITGSISGTVRDVRGQPAVGVPVALSRMVFEEDGTRVPQEAGTATTDDRGEYRIFGVEAGRYYAFAGGSRQRLIKGNESIEPYARSYYPGVDDLAHAGTVDLEPGGRVERIDFTLRLLKEYRIRGRIIDAKTNMPPVSPGMSTSTGSPGNLSFNPVYNSQTGEFELSGLAPGDFKVSGWLRGSPCGAGFAPDELFSTNSDGIPSFAGAAGSTPVRLGEGDLDNVLVVIRHGGCLKGSVTTEGKPLPHWFALELRATGSPANTSILMADNGTFKVDGLLPGTYKLFPRRLPDGFYLKSATFGGADVLNKPFEYSAEGSAQVQILLSSKVARIEGAVTAASGKLAEGVLVVLVPEHQRDRYDLYVATQTGENGRFVIEDITPGDYVAFAWETIEENAWVNADFLSRYMLLGKSAHVAEASKETLNLRVIPAERPK